MSEGIESAGTAVAESGTTSPESTGQESGSSDRVGTQAIAASVFDELEADETPDTSAEAPAPATETPAVIHKLSPAAEFLLKQGHRANNRHGGKTYIPYSAVEGMLDRYLGEHKTSWEGERTTLSGERDTFKLQVEQLVPLLQLMDENPRGFLEHVAQHDERYKPFLTPAEAAAVAHAADAPANDPMPEPDYDLGNGQRTYSLAGLQKRDEWIKRQLTRDLEAKIEAKLKPLTEREQKAEAQAKADRVLEGKRESTRKLMTEAQSWPLFGQLAADGSLTPFQAEVLAALKADKSPGTGPEAFYRAYQKVALPRLTEDDNKKRERLLKEIAKAPKSPTVARAGAETTKAAGPRSIRDIASSVFDEGDRA